MAIFVNAFAIGIVFWAMLDSAESNNWKYVKGNAYFQFLITFVASAFNVTIVSHILGDNSGFAVALAAIMNVTVYPLFAFISYRQVRKAERFLNWPVNHACKAKPFAMKVKLSNKMRVYSYSSKNKRIRTILDLSNFIENFSPATMKLKVSQGYYNAKWV